MAKYLKSFFQPDKKKTFEEDDKSDCPPSLEGRRKLSVSRSGRMRHAQKKRHSLSLDIYKETHNQQSPERPKTQEYHVNPADCSLKNDARRKSTDSKSSAESGKSTATKHEIKSWVCYKDNETQQVKTPEEEIDKAFEIIDKS